MCKLTTLLKYISITNTLNYSYEYKNNYIVIRIRINVIIQYQFLCIVYSSVFSS